MQLISVQDPLYAVEFRREIEAVGQRGIFKVIFPRRITIAGNNNPLAVSFEPRNDAVVERLHLGSGTAGSGEEQPVAGEAP